MLFIDVIVFGQILKRFWNLTDYYYFLNFAALASDRTNQMTKTHNDLDAILQLLQEVSCICG